MHVTCMKTLSSKKYKKGIAKVCDWVNNEIPR